MSPSTHLLPALRTKPKAIFFTDFDGTITRQDSNDWLTDTQGFGYEVRRQLNKEIIFDGRCFRDAFQAMLNSITTPFDECIELVLQNIELDPAFKEFSAWCRDNNVPIIVLSGGMEPVIRALLAHLLGEEEAAAMQIVSNNVMARPGKDINDESGWDIDFRDDSEFGHDKSQEIRPYSALDERPVLFYAGDGVSDLSAARETDLLFAKAGRDLVKYCEKEEINFTVFEDFSDIHKVVEDVVEGRVTVKQAVAKRAKRT
ncbi:HAD-like domain-containing protein [Xylaria intraflava]|nr:HAD-like domain-containing protein [Xylaria intraflava]